MVLQLNLSFMMKQLWILVMLMAWPFFVGAQNITMEEKIWSLINQMTLAEKAGQMNQYNGFYEATGPAPTGGSAKQKYEDLRNGHVGSMLNVRGVDEVREIQKLVVENSRLGIPLLFASDIIHGYKTLAPIPLAEAASWDLAAIERSARMAAIEATATGVNWTFAPMVDISRDARWGRVMEGAGEDPYYGSEVARARVRGFQGDDLTANNTLLACAKHFAAYGFAEAGKDYNTVDISLYTLYNIVFPPFEAAAEEGVRTFMNSFNLLNGIPATGSAFLQREILKGKWGFKGAVVSDWGSVEEMLDHGAVADTSEAAMRAILGGNDIDMESSAYHRFLVDLVESGKVSEELVDDAVYRILKLKFELGLMDDPYLYCDNERESALLYNEAHRETALDIAKRSIVLLKNDNNLLPLTQSNQQIVVIGQLAADKSSPLGSWRIGSDDETAVSVLEGLNDYTDQVTYVQGPRVWNGDATFRNEIEVNETDTTGMYEAVEAARKADVVIMVLGEHGFMSGEGRSRTDIDLPGVQQALLEAVYNVNQQVVLVLMNGRPLAIEWADENVPAILETWHLGTTSGTAIAQTLFGDNNPSGKLPMTFPRSVGQVPIYYNHHSTGRPVPDYPGSVFWAHYTDEKNSPLYPFGYGLSYTKFEYSDLQVAKNGNAFTVSVQISNIGDRTGEEVVQLYIQKPSSMPARPVRELKGFKKIALEAGQSELVTFSLTAKELGHFLADGSFVIENGTYHIWVGQDAASGLMQSASW